MWDEFAQAIIKSGVWAAMFVFLLFYVLKDGKERETKYQQTISVLGDRLARVNEIGDDIRQMRAAQAENIFFGGKTDETKTS